MKKLKCPLVSYQRAVWKMDTLRERVGGDADAGGKCPLVSYQRAVWKMYNLRERVGGDADAEGTVEIFL